MFDEKHIVNLLEIIGIFISAFLLGMFGISGYAHMG